MKHGPDEALRVLIVEDEALLAAELEYLVAASGARPVGHAMTSPEALEMAHRLHPDLALVDIHLADGPSGVDAARVMTAQGDAAVLFLTANVKRVPDDFAGACGVVAKPYSEHGILSALSFLDACLHNGRAEAPPPPGLTLAPAYAKRWGLDQAA